MRREPPKPPSEMSDDDIEVELVRVEDVIDGLYWNFTRQARAAPPACSPVGRQAYDRRAALRAERARRRSQHEHECPACAARVLCDGCAGGSGVVLERCLGCAGA